MKRYLESEDFIEFLTNLKENKITELFTESIEDNSITTYNFLKMKFSDNTIILYDAPYCCTGIIQDSSVAPWDDYAEGVFEDLTMNDEYKVYIEM